MNNSLLMFLQIDLKWREAGVRGGGKSHPSPCRDFQVQDRPTGGTVAMNKGASFLTHSNSAS